jgi:hypothetical protein
VCSSDLTSSEEIKEGCLDLIKYKNHTLGWYLMIKNNSTVLIKYDGSGLYFNTEITKIFKIILTTDTKLIADGVQSINDDFLEWFVKNPSCESVEVESNKCLVKRGQCSCSYQDIDCQCSGYKIIIPQEDWLLNNPQCKQIESCSKSLSKKCICPKEKPKQETLEEAAEKYENSFKESIGTESVDFIAGAKWQKEQDKNKYSEEDLKLAYNASQEGWIGFDFWFEQFKNK